MKLKVLDTFAGIGGFSLGLERTGGFETVAFCEIEPFCQKVLTKNWPHVPIYSDVRSLNAQRLRADGIAVDVITGGFPCQDISAAGKGAGLEGERSGLWFELKRLIEEIKPKYAIIENVSALRTKGLEVCLQGLNEIGYGVEWHCIPASAVGAPHQRDRIWIMAYPTSAGWQARRSNRVGINNEPLWNEGQFASACSETLRAVADTGHTWVHEQRSAQHLSKNLRNAGRVQGDDLSRGGEEASSFLADTDSEHGGSKQQLPIGERRKPRDEPCGSRKEMADPSSAGLPGRERLRHYLEEALRRQASSSGSTPECGSDGGRPFDQWDVEPDVGRVADGVPDRAHRLKALGNAVVPQIPQLIGEAILQLEKQENRTES